MPESIKPPISNAGNRGFTLLEVLIAFTVLTISAGIMLQQMHAMMKYTERARVKQAQIIQTLNQANLFAATDWRRVTAQLNEQRLQLVKTDEDGRSQNIEIKNYIIEDVDVPMTVAFSPFQVFDFGGQDKFALRLLQPGLLPEAGSAGAVLGRSY